MGISRETRRDLLETVMVCAFIMLAVFGLVLAYVWAGGPQCTFLYEETLRVLAGVMACSAVGGLVSWRLWRRFE